MKRLARIALAAIAIAAALSVTPYIAARLEAPGFVFASAAEAPTSTAALVLGASVYKNGDLSPVLEARAERAAELYALGKVKKILVSGDNGDLSHNEVNPVGQYLLARGVPKADIFLDHAGFDTYSSMYRAREVFGIGSLTVVSQEFHLPRALLIAHALGLQAVGVAAAGDEGFFSYNTLREIPATLKAAFDLATGRIPKYTGPEIPIGGDGSGTWE